MHAQMYLTFPPEVAEPPLVLRGFERTAVLEQGEDTVVTLELRRRDVSVWSGPMSMSKPHSATSGQPRLQDLTAGWRPARGVFRLHIGASSRDLRLSHSFEVTE